MAIDLTKFILRFVEEARDHLGKMAEGIAILEQGSDDAELINALFRSAHTIKGSSRMVKLITISETAHSVEDLLSALRDGKLQFSPTVGQALYLGLDGITKLVDRVADQPDNPDLPAVDKQLCNTLTAAMSTQPTTAEKSIPDSTSDVVEAPDNVDIPEVSAASVPEAKLKTADTVRVKLTKLDELIKLMGEVVSSHTRMRQRLRDLHKLEQCLTSTHTNDNFKRELSIFGRALNDDVLAQNLLMDELHDKTLVMRMLPLAVIFDSAGSLIREQARSLGKQVECVINGSEIELDRQIIDQLSDPIIHLLRNSLDHGLELPEQRVAAGKPAIGRITLTACQDGGWVLIEISDDGAGINVSLVKEKAIRKGILSAEAASSLSQEDIINLIFLPGFSTSSIITDMSGRGVGMNVVKSSIVDDLQGTISVSTQLGQGSTFSLRLPLSLAVMRVLLVEVDGLPFGFTSQHIASLVRVPKGSLMVVTAGRNAVVIDNEFVPVVALADLVKIPNTLSSPKKITAASSSDLLLIIVQVRNQKMALIVDELLDEYDMVIKQLPDHLCQNPLVSGMVITGKRELVNVLHAPTLFDMSQQLQRASKDISSSVNPELGGRDKTNILVVDDSLNTREIEKDLLETYGYRVTLAEDGLDALEIIARSDVFDAVLTDVEMPNMDGFTLTAKLREDENYRNTPIIIITSREQEEDKRRGIKVGADAYIVKSDFEHTGLVDTLRSLLG